MESKPSRSIDELLLGARFQFGEFTLEQEAKAIVANAFRNGPIEDVHATPESKLGQEEMKRIMKYAVDKVFAMLQMREKNPDLYKLAMQAVWFQYAKDWDTPKEVGVI